MSALGSDTSLQGLALLELDSSGDLMHVWSYPGVDESTKRVLLARSQLATAHSKEFVFHRFGACWYYSVAAFSVEVPKVSCTPVRRRLVQSHLNMCLSVCSYICAIYDYAVLYCRCLVFDSSPGSPCLMNTLSHLLILFSPHHHFVIYVSEP